MVDAIIDFTRHSSSILIQQSGIVLPVLVKWANGSVDMVIESNGSGLRVSSIARRPVNCSFVKTPLGLVKQANALFKQFYGDTPDAPVLHVKSYGLRGANEHGREYRIQDLTRIYELLKDLSHLMGGEFPVKCIVYYQPKEVCFLNIHFQEVDPPAGIDTSGDIKDFRESMVDNGFKFIR